jgi:hypothetical protein
VNGCRPFFQVRAADRGRTVAERDDDYQRSRARQIVPLQDASGNRRGAILVLAAFFVIVIFAFTAFTVDLGYIALVKAELQNSADAAAMAGAWELLHESRLQKDVDYNVLEAGARKGAAQFAALNMVAKVRPNVPNGDIVIGRLNNGGQIVTGGDHSSFNAVKVTVSRSAEKNGVLPLLFGPFLGKQNVDLTATAVAKFESGVTGFRPNARTGNSSLIPFAIKNSDWANVLAGNGKDNFSADSDTDAVGAGSDGLKELDIFNGSNNSPGNFGTLNIGRSNQGLPGLLKQIRNGVGEADLEPYGGELSLDSGKLELGGDPGFSTPVFSAAQEILGRPVAIPIYSTVTGSGANTKYTIVGFAAVRIVDVVGHGNNKHITVQPCLLVDDSAINNGGSSSSHVYSPVKLAQ